MIAYCFKYSCIVLICNSYVSQGSIIHNFIQTFSYNIGFQKHELMTCFMIYEVIRFDNMRFDIIRYHTMI